MMKNTYNFAMAMALCLLAISAQAVEKKAPAVKAEKQAPASAASDASGTAKYDTKLPVEISSDTLEVLQRENKAIFKGNVIAVQGKLRLNADAMIVHYKQKDASAPAAQPAAGGGDMGAVDHIDVEGNVLVVTPEESAQGDKGNYNVGKRFLRLTGENVTLTRDQNILRGKSVEYDLNTGHSILTNGDGTGKGDTRVRGVFVPNSTAKPGEAKPADANGTEKKPDSKKN